MNTDPCPPAEKRKPRILVATPPPIHLLVSESHVDGYPTCAHGEIAAGRRSGRSVRARKRRALPSAHLLRLARRVARAPAPAPAHLLPCAQELAGQTENPSL